MSTLMQPTCASDEAELLEIIALLTAIEALLEAVPSDFSVTPTVSTSPAYASGDLVGGKLSFTVTALGALGFILDKVIIKDSSKQQLPLHLVLFNADPSGTTFTDNAAFAPAAADLAKIIGYVSVTAYSIYSANSIGEASNLNNAIILPTASPLILYGALVSQGIATYATTSALTVTITTKPVE